MPLIRLLRAIGRMVFILLLAPSAGFCQNSPFKIEGIYKKNLVSAPDMAAMTKNIVYPVNHSTGTVEIKIPLYEVKSGTLTLPIYLTYNTGGVKLQDSSGWVGQGWSLFATPAISRMAQGHIDTHHTCNFSQDYMSGDPYSAYEHILSVMDNNVYSGLDEQPDEYYYKLPEKSGMFMYSLEPKNSGTTYLPIPYEDVKITYAGGYFTIVDDNGTTYRFEGGKDWSSYPANYESGWRSSLMVSACEVDSISFEYGNPTQACANRHEDFITVIDDFWPSNRSGARHYNNLGITGDYPPDLEERMASPIVYTTFDDRTYSWQVNTDGSLYDDGRVMEQNPFVAYVYTNSNQVKYIRFKGNTVQFEQTGGQLDRITVRDASGQTVRSIKFDYLGTGNGRKFLSALHMQGSDGQDIENYAFEYDHPYHLPATGARSFDFWGYNNGVSRQSGESLVPQMTIHVNGDNNTLSNYYHGDSLTIGCAKSRGADEQYMRYGRLTKITYPTGSTDEFSYEANRVHLVNNGSDTEFHMTDYLSGSGGIYQVGGLRITQIKSTNRNREVCFRTFVYGTNECGYGRTPMLEDGCYFLRTQQKLYPALYGGGLSSVSTQSRTYSATPTFPITYENGASVMYSTVTEYAGTLQENTGKTVYQYAVPTYIHWADGINLNPYTKYVDWQYGHMTAKTVYKKTAASQYEKVQQETYDYSTAKNMGKIKAGYHCLTTTCANPHISDVGLYGATVRYDLFASYDVTAKLMNSQTTTRYDGAHSMITTTTYSYGNADEVTMTGKTVMRAGVTQAEEYVHPSQLKLEDGTNVYNKMFDRHILSPVVETIYTRGSRFLKVQTPYTERTAGPYTFYQPSSLWLQYAANGTAEQRLAYTYDDRGNLVQTVKDGQETETYLYGYNSQYPVAEIQGVSYNAVSQQLGTAFVASLRQSPLMSDSQWAVLNALRTQLTNAFVITYRTCPLVGVTSVTDPAGHETRFRYDSLGRLSGKGIMHNGAQELLEEYLYHYKTE